MGWLERVKGFFHREAEDAREIAGDLERRADEALSRRERALEATPQERLEMTLDEIAAADAVFDQLRHSSAQAAHAEFDPVAKAREWVRVDGDAEPTGAFSHTVLIAADVGTTVGEERLSRLAALVRASPRVDDARHDEPGVLHVAAPGLSAEQVRDVVVASLAPWIRP